MKDPGILDMRVKDLWVWGSRSTGDEGAGFLTDTNKITMLTRDGEVHKFGLKKKTEVAQDIVQFTVQYILDAQHIL